MIVSGEKIKKRIFFSILFLILYKLSMDLVYVYIVSPVYFYQGFVYEPKLYKYVVSFFLFVVMLYPMYKLYYKNRASSKILNVLNLIYFIPGTTLYAFSDVDNKYFLFFSLYWILLLFWQAILPRTKIKFKPLMSAKLTFRLLTFMFLLLSVIIVGKYNSFNLNLNFSVLYDLRDEQRSLELPRIIGYIQPLAVSLIPVALIFSLTKKKYILTFSLIFVQLLLFSFGGAKFTFFAMMIALAVYFFYEHSKDYLIALFFCILNLLSLVEGIFYNGSSKIAAYIQTRILLLTNLLGYQYYDFFKNRELLYLRESIFGRLGFEKPYDMYTVNIIGDIYYKNPESNANTGLCGDAFANFGWVSLLMYPLIIILLLRLLDKCTINLEVKPLMTICVLYSITLTNASLFTMLLTNGFLFMCFYIFIYPRDLRKKQKENTIGTKRS